MGAEAHTVALLLVAIDLLARSARIRCLLAATGGHLVWRDAIALNAWTDLAAAVTPMRLGGEPARLAALAAFGITPRRAVTGLGLELLVATPVTVLIGSGLMLAFGGVWLSAVNLHGWWVPGFIAGASVLVVIWLRGRVTRSASQPGASRSAGAGVGPLTVGGVLTLVSVGARVAVLPVLVGSGVPPLELGALALGSYVLLFGQALMPLPSGAGIVEAVVMQGGAPGADLAVLVAWRIYTTGVGVALGVALLCWRGGRAGGQGLRHWLRRQPAVGRRIESGGVVPLQGIEDRVPPAVQRGAPCPRGQPVAESGIGE